MNVSLSDKEPIDYYAINREYLETAKYTGNNPEVIEAMRREWENIPEDYDMHSQGG